MLLHGGVEHHIGWVWEPSVLAGLAVLAVGYALAVGPLRRRFQRSQPVPWPRQAAFYTGTLCVFAALVSPLDSLSDEILFSAHMGQHLLLMFAAPPLWLLGVPGWLVEALFPPGQARQALVQLMHPAVAFVIFTGIMWAWHVPAAYDTALAHEWLHIIEHLAFMAAAVVGWWPVLGWYPDGERPPRPVQVLYLFAISLPCTALAALITLSPAVLYPFYGNEPLAYGLTPLADQQLGGLLMWLPGDMTLMAAATVVLIRWFDESSRQHVPVES
jgi:putative membrane protein